MAQKGGPRDTRAVDPLSGRFVTPKEPTISDQSKNDEGDEAESDTSSQWKPSFVVFGPCAKSLFVHPQKIYIRLIGLEFINVICIWISACMIQSDMH